MKKCLIIIILIFIWGVLSAQDGFKSARAFDTDFIPVENRTVTLVTGSKIRPLRLSVFHSVKSVVSAEVFKELSGLVLEDARRANAKETEIVHGDLVYALLSFKEIDKMSDQKFICFQSQATDDGKYEVILVYMEGNTTIEDLKNKFNK